MEIFKTVKKIFNPTADTPKKQIRKRPVNPPKKDAQPTLGHAPAQHPITEEELKKLVKAASDPEVQDVIDNQLVLVFHPENQLKKPTSLRNK